MKKKDVEQRRRTWSSREVRRIETSSSPDTCWLTVLPDTSFSTPLCDVSWFLRPHRLTVRTPLFQGGNRSSILLGGRGKKASRKGVARGRRARASRKVVFARSSRVPPDVCA